MGSAYNMTTEERNDPLQFHLSDSTTAETRVNVSPGLGDLGTSVGDEETAGLVIEPRGGTTAPPDTLTQPESPTTTSITAEATPPADNPSALSPETTNNQPSLPPWLLSAKYGLEAVYPEDSFGFMFRNSPAAVPAEPGYESEAQRWRVVCTDCPGKLYIVGVGETLSNFEVHLKNRRHKQRVQARLSGDR